MNKSKIEWCDHTWNPITGCRHNCSYCYARRMTARFAGDDMRRLKKYVKDNAIRMKSDVLTGHAARPHTAQDIEIYLLDWDYLLQRSWLVGWMERLKQK